MNKCSYFITDKALFVGFPTEDEVKELEAAGVVCFIDLTFSTEKKISKYSHNSRYINFPIPDRKVPTDLTLFYKFILMVCDIIEALKPGELIYLHCKGGHGRSGIVVACVLCQLYGYTPDRAMHLTNEYHKEREVMKERWRELGSPQTRMQKSFVTRMFDPLYVSNNFPYSNLSNFSLHTVVVPALATFPTAEAAYQAHRDINNVDYIRAQTVALTPELSQNLGRQTCMSCDINKKLDTVMYEVVKLKFQQHEDIREELLHTGLRPIKFFTGVPFRNTEEAEENRRNLIGKLLMRVRDDYHRKDE